MERLKAIYKLIDSNKNVVYVGQTYDPILRLKDHLEPRGLFHGRLDIKLEIIEWVPCVGVKKKEEYWQLYYGLSSDLKRTTNNKKSWETKNLNQEKKKETFRKIIETRDSDPEKIKQRIEKFKLTIKLKKLRQNENKES